MAAGRYLFFMLTVVCRVSEQGEVHPAGHMQPLGSHRPMEGEIERLDHVPDPLNFYLNYVQRSKPFVMAGAVKDTLPLKKWTDDYLKSNFGDSEVHVEMKKKEDRRGPVEDIPLKEFIQRYRKEPLYIAGEVPDGMREQVYLPGCLSCGGFLENVNTVFMWFSSGGTKSVLHTDSFHNMHCVVSGEKRFIMIPPKYTKVIGPEWEGQGYYNLDVDAVNMTAYPNMVDAPWYKAVLNPGDCLYIPYHWIHHVHSIDRNIGINLWWAPFQVSMEECEGRKDFKDLISLEDVVLRPFLAIKAAFLNVMTDDGKVYAEDVLARLQKAPMIGEVFTRKIVDELFDIVQPNSGGVLEESTVLNIPHDQLMQVMDVIARVEEEKMMELYEGGGFPPDEGMWPEDVPYPPHDHHEL